jgi:hypothetical protein
LSSRLLIRKERDANGELVRVVIRAGPREIIDEVVLIRGPRKWRTVIGLVKRPPDRKINGVRHVEQ